MHYYRAKLLRNTVFSGAPWRALTLVQRAGWRVCVGLSCIAPCAEQRALKCHASRVRGQRLIASNSAGKGLPCFREQKKDMKLSRRRTGVLQANMVLG